MASDSTQMSYSSMVPSVVSCQVEPEVAESEYFFIHKITLLPILTIAVSDGESKLSNTSAPAATRESLYHYPDAQLAPAPTRKETPERKWKDAPPTTSTETTVITKRIKTEGSGSRGHLRQADFDELTWSLIEETISIYRTQISSLESFPERADDRDTVKQAWVEVCTSRNVRLELEEDIFKLVSDNS